MLKRPLVVVVVLGFLFFFSQVALAHFQQVLWKLLICRILFLLKFLLAGMHI